MSNNIEIKDWNRDKLIRINKNKLIRIMSNVSWLHISALN